MNDVLLKVENLDIYYQSFGNPFHVIKNVSFDINKNEIFGIVGESGSGKSTLCMGLLKILPPSSITKSKCMEFNDVSISDMSESSFNALRWNEISYIPQSAMNTLNPVTKMRNQFFDTIIDHNEKQSYKELEEKVIRSLMKVNLGPDTINKYPYELSGGMKQRVCIALSMILNPKLIIADEPTSALDVITQRTIIEILVDLKNELASSIIMVGHDMALQAQIADRIGIMYSGYFVEIGSVKDIFKNPLHPYTKSLLASIPSINRKQNMRELASNELSEEERENYNTPSKLIEVEKGHYVTNWTENNQ